MKNIIVLLLTGILFLSTFSQAFAAPNLGQLNSSIVLSQKYYEGLYKDLGDRGAVVNEYYSSPKSVYTVRHGVIGGIYYYTYTGDMTKANQLRKFATSYGFNPDNDIHSFIWKDKSSQPANEIYSNAAYHDCNVNLPTVGSEMAYHSKVCKLGSLGLGMYEEITKHDTLLPTVAQLQAIESGRSVDVGVVNSLQNRFNKLGNGIPICFMGVCGSTASTIRTAEFGELEMRLGNMKYADKIATAFMKAENENGAVYFSYDKNGNLKDDKGFAYAIVNKVLSDDPIFKGYIPTNAETMNDVLAFLLHYRCDKYHVCNK